jgi:hypothetical protein
MSLLATYLYGFSCLIGGFAVGVIYGRSTDDD